MARSACLRPCVCAATRLPERYNRTNVRRLLLLLILCLGCGRREPAVPAAEPLPSALPSVTVETPAASEVAAATPTESMETNVIEVRVLTPTPVDVSTIPNFDRPSEPTPGSAAERRAKCLSYTVERETFGESKRVKVRVRNACGFWIPPEESWFEISAMPANGQGISGRATGSFQTPIGPNSSNVETFIEVDCPGDVRGGCKYYVEAK